MAGLEVGRVRKERIKVVHAPLALIGRLRGACLEVVVNIGKLWVTPVF